MAQHQRNIAELERQSDGDADDTASTRELSQEMLKELRQIRGILGHMAKEVATARPADSES